MIPALTISILKNKIKENYLGQEAVIGVMLGRYNIQNIQQAIDESYEYWHLTSNKSFDIYWAGYGVYWGERNSNQTILNCAEKCNGVYFDLTSFVTFKNDFKSNKEIPYKDTFQLVLCNVKNGDIKFDEHIIINLEENLNGSTAELRNIMENVIELCQKESTVSDVSRKMKTQAFWQSVKGITVADIIKFTSTAIGNAASIAGITPQQ